MPAKHMLVALLTLVLAAACAFTPGSQLPLQRAVVTAGAARLIANADDPHLYALKVRHVAGEVSQFLDTDAGTVLEVEGLLRQRIADSDLSPTDRVLAGEFVVMLTGYLQTQVNNGVLPEDVEIQLGNFLGWVVDAASYY